MTEANQIEFERLREIRHMALEGHVRRRGGGERVVVIVSVDTEGDLNSKYDKSALPSYSRIDFADIFDCWVSQRTVSWMQMRSGEKEYLKRERYACSFCCRTFWSACGVHGFVEALCAFSLV